MPKDFLEPVSLDDIRSQLSTAPSVLVECGPGTRPPESLAREQTLALDKTRAAWKPPPDPPPDPNNIVTVKVTRSIGPFLKND